MLFIRLFVDLSYKLMEVLWLQVTQERRPLLMEGLDV